MGKHAALVGAGALCTMLIQGHNYPEMEMKAREQAAKFFGVDEAHLIVVDPSHARVAKYADFQDDDKVPDLWEATFTIGINWPEGSDLVDN